MTKKEILTEIYPDELDYIFEEMKLRELKRYEGYYNELMAGLIGNTKEGDNTIPNYFNEINNAIKKLTAPVIDNTEPDGPEVIKDKLQGFAGLIKEKKGV